MFIVQLAIYKGYILPIGWLHATYHLLGEPETTIESVNHLPSGAQEPMFRTSSSWKAAVETRDFRPPEISEDTQNSQKVVSENSGFSPQIIHFNRVFHYKPSILGYHYSWKHPSLKRDTVSKSSFWVSICNFWGVLITTQYLKHVLIIYILTCHSWVVSHTNCQLLICWVMSNILPKHATCTLPAVRNEFESSDHGQEFQPKIWRTT